MSAHETAEPRLDPEKLPHRLIPRDFSFFSRDPFRRMPCRPTAHARPGAKDASNDIAKCLRPQRAAPADEKQG